MINTVKAALVVVAVSLAGCGGAPEEPDAAGLGLNSTTRYFCNDGTDDYHEIWRWPDGSVMTTCTIGWTGSVPSSATALWRSNQQGAAGAVCLVRSGTASYGEYKWNGGNASTLTVYGSTTKTYSFPCIQQ